MKTVKELTTYLYRHHFTRYLIVGGSTFIIDFSLLFLLHSKAKVSIPIATSISYWISICYNFVLNRYWTFDVREKASLKKHLMAYAFLLLLNYIFVVIFVSVLSHHINYIIAKALAVVIQMMWTYPVYKKFIFVPLDLTTS